MHRLVHRFIFALVAAMLLQGCSAVRLGYGNADSLARWWIDQYVDMSPEQDALARERLSRLLAWHRKTQLPDYVSILRQGQKFVAGQPTAGDALALGDAVVRRGRALADQATPDIAEFLATVTPAQIERMAGRQAEKNADYAKEAQLADGESGQRKARYKRLLERAEYWFDDFSSEQKSAMRRLIDGQGSGSQFWYEERLRRQREWLDLVRLVQRERPPRERVMQMLRDYAARFDLPADPVRLAQATALRRSSAELAVAIHAMTTPAQRAHAEHKLGDLIRDFTELSQDP
ncbi:MAG: hypothetical protein FD118_3409 [Rhodocyclaceae bacterium]|nr:MAG: hypothetical protein FD118_3409 [Rhodocyclaceae bacterium]